MTTKKKPGRKPKNPAEVEKPVDGAFPEGLKGAGDAESLADAPTSQEAFPKELSSPEEPKKPRVNLPPIDNPENPFAKDKTGAERDSAAAKAVEQGQYVPGVRPEFDPTKEKLFLAPDDVYFVGSKDEDILRDPRNGRMIRPAR